MAPENTPKMAIAVLSKSPSRILNPESIAVKNNIVNGLEMVRKKTETKSLNNLLLFCCWRACLMVFVKNRNIPKITSINPPPIVRYSFCSVKNFKNTLKLKPAIVAKKVSAVAAPKPDTKPDNRPRLKVRWRQIIPIGPSGIETDKPNNIPSK